MRPVPVGFLVGRGQLSAVMFERVRAEHAALIRAAPGARWHTRARQVLPSCGPLLPVLHQTGRPEAQRVGRVVVVQRAMTAIREDEVGQEAAKVA